MAKFRPRAFVDAIQASEVLDGASSGRFSATTLRSGEKLMDGWVVEAFERRAIGLGADYLLVLRDEHPSNIDDTGDFERAGREDWVVRGTTGKIWVVGRDQFARDYEAPPSVPEEQLDALLAKVSDHYAPVGTLTATEAVFGVLAMLTTLPHAGVTLGAAFDADVAVRLANEFIRANNLGRDVSMFWPGNLHHPASEILQPIIARAAESLAMRGERIGHVELGGPSASTKLTYSDQRGHLHDTDAVETGHVSAPLLLTDKELEYLREIADRDTLNEGYGDTIRKALRILTEPVIVTVQGNVSPEQFRKFKEQWLANVGGISNAWKTPIINSSITDDRRDREVRVGRWTVECFGDVEALSVPQRAYRLLEETIELAQAVGVDGEKAAQLLAYTYSRPPGVVEQELGGVGVCLLAFGYAANLDVDAYERLEVNRVLSLPPSHFTERNKLKNDAGLNVVAKQP